MLLLCGYRPKTTTRPITTRPRREPSPPSNLALSEPRSSHRANLSNQTQVPQSKRNSPKRLSAPFWGLAEDPIFCRDSRLLHQRHPCLVTSSYFSQFLFHTHKPDIGYHKSGCLICSRSTTFEPSDFQRPFY
ncbi:hypothetical protein ASPSYDRAFT_383562 [Aspergillus sydowii CBS 593.65]|uniref:Uncharacterized protein n=1 Tax=Aspergillus sydowii CBS 593.65 TaxID=1036612 RepID=A0A1L9T8R2_9EURO|nr:uncharacterized protein ASPSYDRAFT_383562 [Aspergillus sydowii CBS 593.65]OJJ55819.1 hypothetical protein ASPSYDRAFT_383562 [Aspergillus sydowii CBS 593.65]